MRNGASEAVARKRVIDVAPPHLTSSERRLLHMLYDLSEGEEPLVAPNQLESVFRRLLDLDFIRVLPTPKGRAFLDEMPVEEIELIEVPTKLLDAVEEAQEALEKAVDGANTGDAQRARIQSERANRELTSAALSSRGKR